MLNPTRNSRKQLFNTHQSIHFPKIFFQLRLITISMLETFICRKCWITFHNQSAMQNHVKRKHQREVQAHLKDGTVIRAKRETDGSFPCPCGNRRFLYPNSLQTHAKECTGKTGVTVTMTANDEFSSEAEVTLESMSTEPEGEAQ